MAKKYDGVIEAVRYKDGQIEDVRAFERRGAAFSDHVLIPRQKLLQQLKDGKKFVIGQRKEYLGSSFETGAEILLTGEVVSTSAGASRDTLDSVPLF